MGLLPTCTSIYLYEQLPKRSSEELVIGGGRLVGKE
jgi:hypothetical protein